MKKKDRGECAAIRSLQEAIAIGTVCPTIAAATRHEQTCSFHKPPDRTSQTVGGVTDTRRVLLLNNAKIADGSAKEYLADCSEWRPPEATGAPS